MGCDIGIRNIWIRNRWDVISGLGTYGLETDGM